MVFDRYENSEIGDSQFMCELIKVDLNIEFLTRIGVKTVERLDQSKWFLSQVMRDIFS